MIRLFRLVIAVIDNVSQAKNLVVSILVQLSNLANMLD